MNQINKLSIRRLVLVLICLQLGFFTLLAKLYILQNTDTQGRTASRIDWRKRSNRVIKRGKILDRHGTVLGISQDRLSVAADPKTFNKKSNAYTVATELAPLLDTPKSELLDLLKKKKNDRYVEFVWLKKGIDFEKLDEIRVITKKHRGLKIEVDPKRVYPKKQLASQVIGYLNDLDIGEGVEFQYHTYLEKLEPSIQGNYTPTDHTTGVQSTGVSLGNTGCNVVLTLDEYIQRVTEKELAQGCKEWNSSKGTAIVLSVPTSEILAMASYPSYDLNDQTNADEEAKRNLGIWYMFEPGSIFKIVASSAVLNEGIMTQESTVFCENGRYRLPNRRAIKDVSAKGHLSLKEVLHKSSNIGMIKIVEKLGPDLFREYTENFGFGKKTGVDLPYEQNGNLYSLRRWDVNSLAAVPFGQGISVTPLQMVNALAVIANGGVLHQPYITKEIRDDHGKLVKMNYPTEIRRVMRPEIAKVMSDILVGVVENGSGRRARIEGVSVAGKTGTAQKAEKGKGYSAGKEVMSFMGFLPAENPKIAIIVTLDEPSGARFSGTIAAPIFQRIATQTIKYIEQTAFFDSIPMQKYVQKNRNSTQIQKGSTKRITNLNQTTVINRNSTSIPSSNEQIQSLTQKKDTTDNSLRKNGEGL
ncbi:penicillin-binding protein 2 [Candidatus Poribacteria bacterium]|nr:penicillin-binding protein 2 [Candidatus Poribacteria bacterium]